MTIREEGTASPETRPMRLAVIGVGIAGTQFEPLN